VLETLRVLIVLILSILLPFAVQRWDRRRLNAEQRARAWNAASWGAALYAFGPLSMIGWCWVTRHAWDRWRKESLGRLFWNSTTLLFKGLLSALGIIAVIAGVDELFGLAEGAVRSLP
jgi:hypothetical protein